MKWFVRYKESDEHSRSTKLSSKVERVRIFLPTDPDGNDLKVKDGDHEIIGPSTGDEYSFIKNVGNANHFDIFEGVGVVIFGIEGVHPGAPVQITMTLEIDGTVFSTDTVQL